jgi:hypothetical protein
LVVHSNLRGLAGGQEDSSMNNNSESESRPNPESTESSRRGKNPESLKNLRRGDKPPERYVEAQAADLSAVAEESSLLDDMRHVRRFPSSHDRTEGRRDCRKWKKSDLKGFMNRLAALEQAELASKPTPDLAVPGKPVNWSGVGECPTCGPWHSKNANGPARGGATGLWRTVHFAERSTSLTNSDIDVPRAPANR